MAIRNQLIRQQLADSSPRRVLGFDGSGDPALLGLVDLIPGQLRLLRADGIITNRYELIDWITATASGINGTATRGPNQVAPSGIYTLIAWVQGLADDESEGYASMIAGTFRRAAAGNEVMIGTSTKIYEAKDQLTGTSSISGNGTGTVAVNYDSGQISLTYTWSIRAIVLQNVNV